MLALIEMEFLSTSVPGSGVDSGWWWVATQGLRKLEVTKPDQ